MNWIIENKEWLFSGVLIAIPLAIISWMSVKNGKKHTQKGGKNSTNIQVSGNLNINGDINTKGENDVK